MLSFEEKNATSSEAEYTFPDSLIYCLLCLMWLFRT